jgi:hypothetical protein
MCVSLIHAAAIPPMRLTFSDFDTGYAMDTLQFFSVKVARIDDNLRWPLDVYGFVAVRDILDRKRNMIFCRDRDNCQTINEQVCSLLSLVNKCDECHSFCWDSYGNFSYTYS